MADQVGAQTFDLELKGCRPEPLASYLKALGILRLVAEQKDREARGYWQGEHFVLQSTLDKSALTNFFFKEWIPTPIVSPWNSGSGFWPSTSADALRSIEASQEPRLRGYANAVAVARNAITILKLMDAPEKGDPKTKLITYLRSVASDDLLRWLDAAAVLTEGEPIYPALLGTGGNDGRQDFSNNYMQRILFVLDDPGGLPASLFNSSMRAATKGSMGQFSPALLERSNAWDFVLTIEGSLILAGAATRRLESADQGTLAFPFHVRAATAPSLAEREEGHGELWLPRWSRPASFREVQKLFAEGRAKTGSRVAVTGLDFARSIATLGVDRGLSEFVRFSFQARNGKNFFATSLGRFSFRDISAARLLDDIDGWFDRFRRQSSGSNVPARIALARRRLEQAMFDAAGTGALGPVLLELGVSEQALAQSIGFTTKAFLQPVPRLNEAWATAAADSSLEQRLAAALAARPGMRERLVPLEKSGRSFGRGDEPAFVFAERPLVENLHALLLREDVEALQGTSPVDDDARNVRCSLTDIARFIDDRTDDELLERWLRALVLVHGGLISQVPAETRNPPALFAVLALVHHRRLGDEQIPRTTGALARACAGDAVGASAPAIRRLNASGRPFPVPALVESPARTRRIAAALAFPLTRKQRWTLESMVLPATDGTITTAGPSQEQA